jgi:heavy metal sensor kinase
LFQLRSIRIRLTLWYTLLLAIILFAFSAGVYLALRSSLYGNLDESLENRTEVLLRAISYENGRPTVGAADAEGNPEVGEDFVRIYDRTGAVTFDNSRGTISGRSNGDRAVSRALSGGSATETSKGQDHHYRTRTVPLRQGLDIVGVLEVGFSDDDVRDTLERLLIIFVVAYPLTIAGAMLSGIFLAGRTLAPIDGVTRLARRITAQDLSQRLDLDLPDDELGRLARTFDEMIGRLDEAFERQRQFTADASHELRTPLTSIKGQVDVALQRERDSAAYRGVLHAVNAEVDRMIRLVSSLLTLARADAGQIALNKQPTAVSSSIARAIEQIRPAAVEKSVSLESHGSDELEVSGDADFLLQLWLNLLDNAVKHTPLEGRVSITWTRENGYVSVSVADTGPGIAAEHLPHIFDRFYRADDARTRARGGAGLGLSISRWIVEAHGGSIEARSRPGGGAVFVVRLPAA